APGGSGRRPGVRRGLAASDWAGGGDSRESPTPQASSRVASIARRSAWRRGRRAGREKMRDQGPAGHRRDVLDIRLAELAEAGFVVLPQLTGWFIRPTMVSDDQVLAKDESFFSEI